MEHGNVIKTRKFEAENYSAVFHKGKTIRIALDPSKPIQELRYPEFYDVKLTNYCKGACPWCYQDSSPASDDRAENIIGRFKEFFGGMTENQLPFQIAFGGGEPTDCFDFPLVVTACKEMGILPNYTTNGLNISNVKINFAKKYCGGVAVSTHDHLPWEVAAHSYVAAGIKTNLHVMISDKTSVDRFLQIHKDFKEGIHYFVLLPYMTMGRAIHSYNNFDYLFDEIKKIDHSNIAFGANFYPYIQDRDWLDISLYEPEILSKYLDLTTMKLYKSSFNLEEVKYDHT